MRQKTVSKAKYFLKKIDSDSKKGENSDTMPSIQDLSAPRTTNYFVSHLKNTPSIPSMRKEKISL